mgnify:FL=1
MTTRNIFFLKEIIFVLLLTTSLITIIYSSFLFPIVISIIISYLLGKVIDFLEKFKIPRKILFLIIYFSFLTTFLLLLLILFPLVFKQLIGLFNDLPFIIQKIKITTTKLIEKHPYLFSIEQTNLIFSNIISYLQTIGKTIISASIISIAIIIKWIIYILIIPIIVFFLLKDYIIILKYLEKIIPKYSKYIKEIWIKTDEQISNYTIGKIIESIIIMIANYILFKNYDLIYSDLLSFIIGISVAIPYIGTIIVSIPLLLISFVQLGTSNDLLYLLSIYTIIQFIDGNILVPILFSEVVNLHPISIMLSIIIFGTTLGLYGVFFAIPLAIFIKAIINLYILN